MSFDPASIIMKEKNNMNMNNSNASVGLSYGESTPSSNSQTPENSDSQESPSKAFFSSNASGLLSWFSRETPNSRDISYAVSDININDN